MEYQIEVTPLALELSLERKTLSLLRDVSGFYNQYGLFVRYVG